MKNKTIICIHGFLESNEMWNFMDELSIEKVYYSIPGHTSDSKNEILPYSISNLAKKWWEEIYENHGNNITIIGHSMGGYIAMEIANQENFEGEIILLNSTYKADSEEKKQDRDRVIALVETKKNAYIRETIPNLFHEPLKYPAEIKAIQESAGNFSVSAIQEACRAMKNRENNINTVQNLKDNCIFILGEEDKAVVLNTILEDQDKFPDAQFYILENCGHMSYIEVKSDVLLILNKIIET